ncbi:uncharacterized protein [Salminus brasiliensis]|uniref:uncharacterized protein n=1 Tax=Salminus brasiliensis TaxID=930266 RepID=UPI003B836198
MSLTVTKAEGVTVFTVTSNPKSEWPLICQILGTLCCSPVYFVSRSMKQHLGSSHTVLGTLQIMVGLLTVGLGCSTFRYIWNEPFCLGGMFIAAGILCIIAAKFPSPCLISFLVLVNLVSFGLAVTIIVSYSVDLANIPFLYGCSPPSDSYGFRAYETTQSPVKTAKMNEMLEICEDYKQMLEFLRVGVDILMIVLSVLQLCVTISSCVLCLKALCKKKKGDKEDPESYKPLLVEEVLSSPAC